MVQQAIKCFQTFRHMKDVSNISEAKSLPNYNDEQPMLFVVVGDEVFGLTKHILRHFPRKNLIVQKKVFNSRHTRARRMVELCLEF